MGLLPSLKFFYGLSDGNSLALMQPFSALTFYSFSSFLYELIRGSSSNLDRSTKDYSALSRTGSFLDSLSSIFGWFI